MKTRFHIQEGTTHWVALNRLKDAMSYLLIASAEAGPMLCPSWPANATWNQATHINYQRFLDAANGGPIPWETKNDRANVGHNEDVEEDAEQTGGFDRTNVVIAFFNNSNGLQHGGRDRRQHTMLVWPLDFFSSLACRLRQGIPSIANSMLSSLCHSCVTCFALCSAPWAHAFQ